MEHSILTPRLIVLTVGLHLALKIGLTQGMNGEGITRMDMVTVEEATVLGFSSLAIHIASRVSGTFPVIIVVLAVFLASRTNFNRCMAFTVGFKTQPRIQASATPIACSPIWNSTCLIARFYSSAHKRVILNRHERVGYCGEKHG